MTDATYPKPWMARREGEASVEWGDRVAHTCAFCGRFDEDMSALADHEDRCPHGGFGGRPARRKAP